MSEEQLLPEEQKKPFKDGPSLVTSGYVGWLTPEEEEKLHQMKSILTEKGLDYADDYELLRFLRARKFDLSLAIQMFEKFKQWYAENHIYKYPDEFPSKAACLADLVPSAYMGFDKDGHPVQIERTGKIDVPTMLSAASDQAILLGWIWGQQHQIRRCEESCQKLGLPKGSIERFTSVMDLDGLSMSHLQMSKFLTSITKCGEANFPERMARTLIVNYGFTFSILWGMLKFTLDPITREKVIPCSNFEELHKYIEPSQLPKRYGGLLEDPESLKDRDVNALRKKYLNDDKYKEQYETIIIPKGERVTKVFDVLVNHEITYCFRANEPVQFKATFIPTGSTDENEHVAVSNDAKVEAVEWPTLGSFQITNDKPGQLIFEWYNDNWWGEKNIKFAAVDIDVVEQEAAEKAAAISEASQ